MLVGREGLLAVGAAAVADAQGGHGRLLLLAGEAGIGKTALAQAIADQARATGAIVRTGACWETEGLPPFTPWLDVLRRPGGDACAAVAAQLDAGIPEAPDAASAARAQARLFADVVDALYTVGADHPQVVLLEDLHWADGASLELLVGARPPPPVAAGARGRHLPRRRAAPNEPPRRPRGPGRAADGDRPRRVRGRGPPHRRAQPPRHRRRSGRASSARPAATRCSSPRWPGSSTRARRACPPGSTTCSSGGWPASSTPCAHVLGAAAVLGHEFDQDVLAAMVGVDVLPDLDEARAARLVAPIDAEPMRWGFVHALVQATRYDGLSAAEREGWHRRAVRCAPRPTGHDGGDPRPPRHPRPLRAHRLRARGAARRRGPGGPRPPGLDRRRHRLRAGAGGGAGGPDG